MEIHTARMTAISQPVIEGLNTPAELLAHHARVSSSANQFKHETGGRLIRRLLERHEPSPLMMVSMNFEFFTTRDIGRQAIRHWTLAPQEFSQRYADPTEEFGLEPAFRECRMQHPTDRQMSVPLGDSIDDAALRDWWQDVQLNVWATAVAAYREARSRGIAKEQCRALLPEGLTPTRMYFNGRLRDWYFYAKLRMDPKTQAEHRSLATCVWNELVRVFPMLEDV